MNKLDPFGISIIINKIMNVFNGNKPLFLCRGHHGRVVKARD